MNSDEIIDNIFKRTMCRLGMVTSLIFAITSLNIMISLEKELLIFGSGMFIFASLLMLFSAYKYKTYPYSENFNGEEG